MMAYNQAETFGYVMPVYHLFSPYNCVLTLHVERPGFGDA